MKQPPLPLHLSIHFVLAVASGWLVGWYFGRTILGIVAGVLGGFLIDLDHVLEYFLVFGLRFNLIYFIQARQFLTSGRLRIWFHAWEYVPLFFLAAWLVRAETAAMVFLLAFNLGNLVHLVSDCFINHMPFSAYSLIYRWRQGFVIEKLFIPEQYQEFLKDKAKFNL